MRQWRLQRQLQKSDLKGQLEISQKHLAKQRRVIEKQLKKQGAAVAEPVTPFITPEELANRPKPKVVDTNALPTEPRKGSTRKPTLAELRGSTEKAATGAGLTTHGWKSDNYVLPGLDLLDEHDPEGRTAADPAELERVQQILIETLGHFGIAVAPGASPGALPLLATKSIPPKACA